MLVEFKVRNFLSINDMQVLRMRRIGDDGTESGSNYAFIYGPNSSGKSNLIKAMDFSRKMILGEKAPAYKPHLDLNNIFINDSPSYFEYVFDLDGIRYAYGFEVDLMKRAHPHDESIDYYRDKNDNKRSVRCEWLYLLMPDGDYKIFEMGQKGRDDCNLNGLAIGRLKVDYDDVVKTILGNNLDIQKRIIDMFRHKYIIRLSEADKEYTPVPKGIIRFLRDNLRRFDTGITDVVIEPFRNVEIPVNLTKCFNDMSDDNQIIYIRGNEKKRHWLIYLDKSGKNKKYYEVRFRHGSDYSARIEEESTGTRKIIQLLTLFASQMVMDNSGIIVIDEIECSIHALAIEAFVKMFKQPNMNGVQLIFTTHQQRVFNASCTNPEDFWFMDSVTEGNDRCSKLYALSSFEGDMAEYGEMYLDGRFSAIPVFTPYNLGGNLQ